MIHSKYIHPDMFSKRTWENIFSALLKSVLQVLSCEFCKTCYFRSPAYDWLLLSLIYCKASISYFLMNRLLFTNDAYGYFFLCSLFALLVLKTHTHTYVITLFKLCSKYIVNVRQNATYCTFYYALLVRRKNLL